MQVVKSTLRLGAKEPFTILHATDTHILRTAEGERESRKKLANHRRQEFPHSEENLKFILDHVKKSGRQLIHTGDLIDFITPENLSAAKALADETGMLFVAGNHEMHTCPNDIFCDSDFADDLARREITLDTVNSYFPNDINYFCKEINGIKLIGINNCDYQVKSRHLERLKSEVQDGLPIILFCHIPLYSEELCRLRGDCMLATPDEIVLSYSPFRIFEQRANDTTREFFGYVKDEPSIKCVVSGHVHFNFESSDNAPIKQIVTGLDTLRDIIIE